jgi:ribosome-binding factor A
MTRKATDRNARLEGTMRSVLAELLRTQVKDPRLVDVTISGIHLSGDRSSAKVYFSVIGDAERERQAGDGFAAAASFVRRELGRRMHLRTVPSLEFLRDESYAYGDRMERLFERLQAEGVLSPSEDEDTGEQE